LQQLPLRPQTARPPDFFDGNCFSLRQFFCPDSSVPDAQANSVRSPENVQLARRGGHAGHVNELDRRSVSHQLLTMPPESTERVASAADVVGGGGVFGADREMEFSRPPQLHELAGDF